MYIKSLLIGTLLILYTSWLYPQEKTELRAVWITNVDSYVMFTDKSIAEAMDYLASINVNVVFPVVWNKGYTLYPSRIMDSIFNKPIIPGFTGRDPLKRMIIEAHRNGIEVIPWFEFGFSPNYASDGNDSGHIIQSKPGWALLNRDGKLATKENRFPQFTWLSGINTEVQNFVISLFSEMIDNYHVDGMQGDDRLPAMPIEGGYDAVTISIYKAEHNGSNPPSDYTNYFWKRWRADKLNQFYARLKDSVKSRGEHLIFAASPSVYPWGYDNYLQDSKTWVESGIVDNIIPQLYRDNISSYKNELNQAYNYIPSDKKDIFYAGILAKSGSYVISPELLLNSIRENRIKGVNGECFFFYEALRANSDRLGDTLKSTYYSEPALLPYRNGTKWRPKAEIINEDEDGIFAQGKWITKKIPGFKPNVKICGSSSDSGYSSISYNFEAPYSGWYEAYFYLVPNNANTNTARFVLYSSVDSIKLSVDLTNSKNAGWFKLGDVYLNKGKAPVIKIDNTEIEAGKYIIADAAMIMLNRKLSPDIIVTEVNNAAPDELPKHNYILCQNYPNPFNPETSIKYHIPEAGNVSIKVYDLLGKEVDVLVNEEKQPGIYEVKFDAGKLSSGIYFYSLISGNTRLTNKLIVLK